MEITTLAAWGEFLGGVAVVVSLVYLAGQVRSNTKTARASNFGDMLLATNQYGAAISDPETASLYLRGIADFAGLSEQDKLCFHGLFAPRINGLYQAWNLHRHGLLDEGMWQNHLTGGIFMFEGSGARQWWDENNRWWQKEFCDIVDGLIREGEATG